MSRALIVINSEDDRRRIAKWAYQAKLGTRVEWKETKRSLPQNSRFYAMLTDIASQKEHCGQRYPVAVWKALMMQAWGREIIFVPTIDGESVIPMTYSSSDLSKQEMTELIEFMAAWGAQNGIRFHDDKHLPTEEGEANAAP